MFKPNDHKPKADGDVLSGYNPSPEELDEMRKKAADEIGRNAVGAVNRLQILREAAEAGLPYVPKEVITGQIPVTNKVEQNNQ